MYNWAENRVLELCEQLGFEPKKTTAIDDSTHHIDLTVILDNKLIGIDVKGARRIARQDSNFSYYYTWFELRNCNGLKGSLFGKAMYFVVASPNGWLWIKREEIATECVLRYIEHNNNVEAGNAWYSKRRGSSVIILVPFTYLYSIAHTMWNDNQLINKCYAEYKQESN